MEVCKDALQTSIIGDEFAGSFLTYAGHARDIIGFISYQRLEVGKFFGCQSIAGLHCIFVVFCDLCNAPLCHLDRDMLIHELQGIHISRVDNTLHALLCCLHG